MSLSLSGVVARGAMRRDIELEVTAGEVTAIMGRNGAGKTTIVRTIAGLQRLSSGVLAFDGRVWDDGGSTWVPPRLRGVGLVMQTPTLFPRRTVAANVAFARRARGASRSEAREAATQWLDVVGAADLAERRAESLSGGETQRVALARALAAEPRLLLLDEPLSAVDAPSLPAFADTIRSRLAAFGGAAVIVVHDEALARSLADRILHLEFTPGR
jgi:molybdate transport system ATP-binding protein